MILDLFIYLWFYVAFKFVICGVKVFIMRDYKRLADFVILICLLELSMLLPLSTP